MGPSARLLGSAQLTFRWGFLRCGIFGHPYLNVVPHKVVHTRHRQERRLYTGQTGQVAVRAVERPSTHLCHSGGWHLVYVSLFGKLTWQQPERKEPVQCIYQCIGLLPSQRTEGQIQTLKAIACPVTIKNKTLSWYLSVSTVLEDWK